MVRMSGLVIAFSSLRRLPTVIPSNSPNPTGSTCGGIKRPHLGFGFGIHFCIGAPLARLVAGSAIKALVRHCPQLKLEGAHHEWQPSLLNRCLKTLPVAH